MLTTVQLHEKRDSWELERRTKRKARLSSYIPLAHYRAKRKRLVYELEEQRKVSMLQAIKATRSMRKTGFFSSLSSKMRGLFNRGRAA